MTFVDPKDPQNFARAIQDNTRLIYIETIGNPKNDILDYEKIAEVAHQHGLPVICDNTVATPMLFRPFEHGIDIVVHSCTKFIGGHGNSIGGAIVDSGRFDWANGRYPELTEPDPSYHGVQVRRELRQSRLHPQGPGPIAAGYGQLHVAVQCVPVPDGPGNDPPADAAALRERPEAGPVARRAGPR